MMSLDFSQSIRRSYNVNKSGVVLIVPHHFWDSMWWQPFIGCHLLAFLYKEVAYYAPAIAGFLPKFEHLEKALFKALLRRNYPMQEFGLNIVHNHRRRAHSGFGKARQLAVGGQLQAAYLVLAVDEAGAGSAGLAVDYDDEAFTGAVVGIVNIINRQHDVSRMLADIARPFFNRHRFQTIIFAEPVAKLLINHAVKIFLHREKVAAGGDMHVALQKYRVEGGELIKVPGSNHIDGVFIKDVGLRIYPVQNLLINFAVTLVGGDLRLDA